MKTRVRTLTASELKAKCLRILEELGPQGVVVTKRGQPIARLTRISSGNNERFFGAMKGEIIVKGDLLSTGIKWHAQS